MATTINLVLVAFLAFIKEISCGFEDYFKGYDNTNRFYSGKSDETESESAIVWIIVGSVVGGLVFIGLLVTVCICVICKCTQAGRQKGSVVRPGGQTTNVAIVSSSTTQGAAFSQQAYQHPPPPQFGMQPMTTHPYPQPQPMPMVQPPPYSAPQQPAYPPPPAAYPPTSIAPGSQPPTAAFPPSSATVPPS